MERCLWILYLNSKKMKHIGSLQQDLSEFDLKLSKIDLNEAQAINHFFGGLRKEIEMSIQLFNPYNIAIDLCTG